MIRRIGGHTLGFEEMPSIIGYASVAGKKESEGPLGKGFDKIIYDSYNGKNTYEQAESTLQFTAVETAMQKAGVKAEDIDYIFAGDLLNQCISSSFGLRDFNIAYLGQYGACSTMAQGLLMTAVFVESNAANTAACYLFSLCLCGKAVPFSSRIRRSSHTDRTVDCYRFGMLHCKQR